MKTVTFFETREELRDLTGLPPGNHDAALWDAGFNLDDLDFGFVSDSEWSEAAGCSAEGPYYEYWLMSHAGNHCVGYDHTEYNGQHYYLLHHA